MSPTQVQSREKKMKKLMKKAKIPLEFFAITQWSQSVATK